MKWISILLPLLLSISVGRADRVALVVNGGYGPSLNFSGFSESVQNWYPKLLELGYDSIVVLDSDGPDNAIGPWTDPMEVPLFRSPYQDGFAHHDTYFWYKQPWPHSEVAEYGMSWVDSPKDYDGDGITDCRYDATVESFDLATTEMSFGSPDDELLVLLFTHGGNDGEYQFGAWDYQDGASTGALIGGVELAGYIDRIPYSKRLIVTASCHAAAIVQHFDNPNTAIMASSGADETGWLANPALDMSGTEYPFPLDRGMSMLGHSMPKGFVDLNDDGRVTWREAWDWAYADNPFGPDAADPIWIGGEYGWATEHPELHDPSGLTENWVAIQYMTGDANADGSVDLQDFSILKANFGEAAGWSGGDFDGDRIVDLQDFSLLKANFGGLSPVPEPPALITMSAVAVLLCCSRSRH